MPRGDQTTGNRTGTDRHLGIHRFAGDKRTPMSRCGFVIASAEAGAIRKGFIWATSY